MGKIKARVKESCTYRLPHPKYNPAKPDGEPGEEVGEGTVIEVTEAELVAFGDKLEVVKEA